jgi:hypothetical protein
MRPECYKNVCTQALNDCPAAKGQALALTKCPSSTHTECWKSTNSSFLCLGRPRPSSVENVESFCEQPGQSVNGTGNTVLAPMNGAGAAGRGAGALGAAVVGAAALMLLLAA